MSPRFVHLSVHTEFSLIDSTVRIKPLVKKVADSMPAVAITDRGNLFALVKFYRAALHGGIKPIAGVDVRIQPDPQKSDIFRALLLVQNDIGYGNLTRLVSRSFQQGQHTGTPVMQRQWMNDSCDGIIMLSGGIESDIADALQRGQDERARKLAADWQHLFGDRYYLELTRTDRLGEQAYIRGACAIASDLGIPVVATNDVRFIDKDDYAAHEARECIQSGYVLADTSRVKQISEFQYLKTEEQMCSLFEDIP